MKFSSPLYKGTLVKRYKRFFADVILENGETITSHCPNTGSMKSCGEPGSTVYLSHSPSPTRKLAYTWEYTATDGGFIGVNTSRPNRVVEEAIAEGLIPELCGYDILRREVKYGVNSKIDLLLEDSAGLLPDCYVEIKNVTLKRDNALLFPDAVTARGLKHLEELSALKADGKRAVMFFLVNRPDGKSFSIASDIDPNYAEGIIHAQRAGVTMLAYQAVSSLEGITVGRAIPFTFPKEAT